MKGYTNFFNAKAARTKPSGSMKYMDWNKVQEIVKNNPDSVIYAGLMEDWNNTSGLIYAKGKYYNGYVYDRSVWATPIIDVDGREIECWTYEIQKEKPGKPSWWGNGEKLYSARDCAFGKYIEEDNIIDVDCIEIESEE